MSPTFALIPNTWIEFGYRNWRGEVETRTALVQAIEWGATEWHHRPGWLMRAFCLSRGAERLFAMAEMDNVRPAAPGITAADAAQLKVALQALAAEVRTLRGENAALRGQGLAGSAFTLATFDNETPA